MQQLHLVGLTTDLDRIICSARKGAKSGSFVLPLDERLLQVIAEAVTRRNADGVEIEVPDALQPSSSAAPRRQSHLSPREIQDRLRSGRSLEDIAAEAGVGEEWVARFAAPVEAERSQVVGRARRLTYYRPRRGDSGEPLGMAVRWNLADRGVRLANDEFDAAWSAYQLADSAWMVTFSYEARKREHEAEWEVDVATNELLSRNRLATELGYVEPGRRRRAVASLQPVASASTTRARLQSLATGTAERSDDGDDAADADDARTGGVGTKARKATKKKQVAKRAVGRPAGRTAAAKKTASKKPLAKKAAAKKAASKKAPAKKAAGKKAPGKKAAAKKATPRPAARTASRSAVKVGSRSVKASGARAGAARSRPAVPSRPARKTAGRPAKAAAKKAVVKKAAGRASKPAAKRPARKAATGPTRRTGRGVPPGRGAPAPVAVVDDRPVPNELGRRRMQLVSGNVPARPAARAGSGARPSPSMPGVRIAASRSGDMAAAQRPERRPERPARPAEAAPPRMVEETVAPEPGLDVGDSEAAAEARRAQRRRARAAARGTTTPADHPDRADRPDRPAPALMAATRDGAADEDGEVVRIRANRASPPRGESELVLPADRPSLRPAQPAAQPRRRGFNRNGR